MLWPYRRSALKNRQRFTFGGVYPPGHSELHPDDRCTMRTECLVRGGGDALLDVRVRFLHVFRRQVHDAAGHPVDELTVAGERHLSWEEAAEREVPIQPGRLDEARTVAVDVPAGRQEEALAGGAAIVRTWEALAGSIELRPEPLGDGLWRVTVEVRNETPFDGGTRAQALDRTFCSTHTVLRAERAEFVSLADPPEELREAAASCRNEGTWPVLVGEPGEPATLLSSPIILEDHPRIAPESPGDLFDGGEIDQLLTLNILSLTDEEKAEMRDSDPRAREILERTEALSEDELMRLHGAIRDFGHVRG
jgi:hypothetical protein